MTVSIVKGEEAQKLIRDLEFREKWTDLFKTCPWSTAFQSHGFVHTWYRIYRDQYEPVIIFQLSPSGNLSGLLALAVHRDYENWVVAGGHQAEYQMWLATPDNGESFIADAMACLCKECKVNRLSFTYILGSAPLDWALSGSWKKNCLVRMRSRPIMIIKDDDKIISSLKKKSNKSRLNRLKRLGPIQFERITEKSQLSKIISDLEVMYDFRLGAVHGARPFQSDKLKRDFHLALMEVSDLLHVTLLKAGNNIVAFHIGVCDEDTVYNGILSYLPFQARHSPGKLHTLLLAKDMAENNFIQFDLTPGRDPWKERFANDRKTVYVVTVYSKAWKCGLGWLSQVAKELAQRVLRMVGAAPHDVRRVLKIRGRRPFRKLAHSLWALMGPRKQSFIYSIGMDKAVQISGACELNRDCLSDLLGKCRDVSVEPMDGFLKDALSRIESGQHPYTAVIDGRLAFCGWLIEKSENGLAIQDHSRGPSRYVIIRDFNIVGGAESVEFLEGAITQMIHDAALIPSVKQILVLIPHNSRMWLEVVKNINLKYAGDFRRVSEEELTPAHVGLE